ncbi:adenosine kinase-like isoform X2 [Planococcus citri]|uniref:adenosine kinase-like isoform X2 n=1 Tax=Planococcus citri TaxID=170843 RepID=UPI0031F7D52C
MIFKVIEPCFFCVAFIGSLIFKSKFSSTMEFENMESRSLVAFGIPTVDYSFLVGDEDEVDRYGLNIDSQREMTHELLNLIKNDFYKKKYKFKKLAGGNCLVSLMVFQNLLGNRNQTTMFGAVGDDEEGLFLEKYTNNAFVEAKFDSLENRRTANCVILIHKDLRTIAVVNGAGGEYSLDKCANLSNKLEIVKRSKVVLFEGFFIAFSYDVAVKVIRHCKKNGNVVVINISGSYVVNNFREKLIDCLSMCDVLIGNSDEFDALCRVLNVTGDSVGQKVKTVQRRMLLTHAANNTVRSKLKCMEKFKKIVVITNNKKPVCCAYGDNELVQYTVPPVKSHLIKDTTGGGDSFLAGFLYGLVKEQSILKCIETGCLVASKVIQKHGYDIDESTVFR